MSVSDESHEDTSRRQRGDGRPLKTSESLRLHSEVRPPVSPDGLSRELVQVGLASAVDTVTEGLVNAEGKRVGLVVEHVHATSMRRTTHFYKKCWRQNVIDTRGT